MEGTRTGRRRLGVFGHRDPGALRARWEALARSGKASKSRCRTWGLLFVLFVSGLMRPQPLRQMLPPPQEVLTTNPKVGVHTRLTDEVEAWKIQASLAMVREMGAQWIVEYFPWAYIEPEPDRFTWEHSDAVISHAENQGLTVIARLGMVPEWARPDPREMETTFTYLAPERYADFASFVGAFVSRYRDPVVAIIVWNEPNLSFEWGYRPVDPAAYVALLRAVTPAAHAANPEVVVLGGALAPTLEPPGSAAGLNDLVYLEEMYKNGVSAYFDALAAHAYGLAFAPEIAPAEDVINFRRIELLRGIMDAYGDSQKEIYVTEAGWNDHPRWAWAVLPGERVRFTLDAYAWAADHWPWCPVVAMWMFRTPQPLYNYQDYYAFVTPDFQALPIYTGVQTYTGNAD